MCAAQRLRPYFQAYHVVFVTSDPLRKILHGLGATGRLILWILELSKFDIEYLPRKAIKAQVLAEVLADFTKGENEEPEGEIRRFMRQLSEKKWKKDGMCW